MGNEFMVGDLFSRGRSLVTRLFGPFRPCNSKGRPLAWVTPYVNFAEAAKTCGAGCESRLYVDRSVEYCAALRQKLANTSAGLGSVSLANTRILAALCGIGKDRLSVVDLGGSAGLHYFIAKAALGPRIPLQWHVVETPSLVRAAGALANEELRFFDSLEEATNGWESVDLVFASGVMQCLPDTLDVLKKFALLRPRALCLTRTAVSPTKAKHVLIQQQISPAARAHGALNPEVRYPVVLLPRGAYERILREHFETVLRIIEEQNVYYINGKGAHMLGYLCRDPR
jgi:putative methyltransferase (TIGR04325 family)